MAESVNGYPSFRAGTKAIWYYKNIHGSNFWMIGPIKHIGTNKGGMCAQNQFGGLTDRRNVWRYRDNNGNWKTTEAGEVIIQIKPSSK